MTDGVHEWFLQRGLPLVLTRRVRARALTERSAPMVGGLGALVTVLLLLADATHGRTPPVHVVLGTAYAAVLAATPALLYVLHRAGTPVSEATRRSVAWLVLALFVLGLPVIDSGWSWTALAEVPIFVVVSMLAVWLTYLGIDSIVLWALRFAWVQFGALGALMSGALPLLMITVLVFFTADLWQLTARLTRDGCGRPSVFWRWSPSRSWSRRFRTRYARCARAGPPPNRHKSFWRLPRWPRMPSSA